MITRPPEWDAPEGWEWVCGACGRHGRVRDEIGDESCFMNAVLARWIAPDGMPPPDGPGQRPEMGFWEPKEKL